MASKQFFFMSLLVSFFVIFFVLLLGVFLTTAVTFDEPNYITAGYAYWRTGDFRLNVEHPPVAKLLAGFPLVFLYPQMNLTLDSWEKAEDPAVAYVSQWEFSQYFFYASGNDSRALLFWGRALFPLLALLLLGYIWKWSSELYREKAGLFAVFLSVFCPLFLAYSVLAITDMVFTVFFFITLYYFWKWNKKETPRSLLLCTLFLGLALATKVTGMYLFPIIIILLIGEICQQRKIISKKETMKKIVSMTIAICCAFIIVSVTYFFSFMTSSNYFTTYFTGLSIASTHAAEGHPAYLLGQYGTQGWWYYFIVAFLVKTPIPLLISIGIAFFLFWKEKKSKVEEKEERFFSDDGLAAAWYILVPALVYFIAFMVNNINIGIRHILPIYPLLIVFASRAILFFNENKWKKIFFLVLCVWYVLGTLLVYPHELSYFNEFVGGPNNGQNILLDSNIDWGQDVGALKQWIQKRNFQNQNQNQSQSQSQNQSLYVSLYTIEQREFQEFMESLHVQSKTIKCLPHAGIVVVSVNHLYDLGQVRNGCLEWLKQREPTEKIGYSIFVYNITDPELVAQENVCISECQEVCSMNNKTYTDYIYVDECVCVCD